MGRTGRDHSTSAPHWADHWATAASRLRLDVSLGLAAIANRAYSIALVVFVFHATHSSVWIGAAAAARYLPGVLTSAFAHRFLNRYAPRLVLVWADVFCAIALAVMGVAIQANASPAIAIVLAAVVRVAASGQPFAAARLLPIVAGGRDLSQVAGRQAATDKLLLLAGPAIGGVLLLAVSPAVELFMLAAVVALAAVISLGLPVITSGARRPGVVGGAEEAWQLRPNVTGSVGIFVALAALSGFVYGSDTVLLAVIANARLHLGDAGYGELFAGLGAGGLLAAPIVNQVVRLPRLAGWLALGMAVYCLPSIAIAHLHTELAVVALEALRGAGSLAFDVVALTELQRIVLPRGLPVLTARLTAVVFAAVAAGALATPALLHWFSTVSTLNALGLLPPVLVAFAYPALRRYDNLMSQRLAALGPRITELASLDLLQATSRPVLERLASDMVELNVAATSTVITQGDVADAFYIVRDGSLDVFVDDRQVNRLHARDWFGEIGLLEGLPRTATVRTVGACVLYRIGGAAFLEAFAQLPPSPSLLDSVAARLATSQPEEPVSPA